MGRRGLKIGGESTFLGGYALCLQKNGYICKLKKYEY